MIPIAKPLIGDEEREAVDQVLASGQLAQGPQVEAFEGEFARLVDGRHCVAVNSGTTALHLGLLAAGIGPGDEVIVPSFTFAGTAHAVRLCGAEPVFVDIDPATFCIDAAAVDAAVGERTAAIMPVHLYGHPAAMEVIGTLADQAGLLVVEDACQAHGAALGGRPVGTFGAVAAFSFYPTKNMTTGEGGMIVTHDPEVARQARLLRNQGMERQYENEVVGFNARMTDVAAAIGRVQLGRLADWNATRQDHARQLIDSLPGVDTPETVADGVHVFHQFTVRVEQRDDVAARLKDRGIGTGVYYPIPVHRLPAFDLDLDLPETARACREVLSLPVHPGLLEGDIDRISTAVSEVVGA